MVGVALGDIHVAPADRQRLPDARRGAEHDLHDGAELPVRLRSRDVINGGLPAGDRGTDHVHLQARQCVGHARLLDSGIRSGRVRGSRARSPVAPRRGWRGRESEAQERSEAVRNCEKHRRHAPLQSTARVDVPTADVSARAPSVAGRCSAGVQEIASERGECLADPLAARKAVIPMNTRSVAA